MPNNDLSDELKGIQELLDEIRKGRISIANDLKFYEQKIEADLQKRSYDLKKRTEEELVKLRMQNIIKTVDEEAAYTQSKLDEEAKRDLQNQIQILEEISSIKQEERDRERKFLERQLDIQKKFQDDMSNAKFKTQDEQIKAEKKARKDLEKNQKKLERDKRVEQKKEELRQSSPFEKLVDQWKENMQVQWSKEGLNQMLQENLVKTMQNVGKKIEEGLNAINNAISSYAKYQTAINSRLQGIGSFEKSVDILKEVAYSPLIRTSDLYANLSQLIGEGIVTNVEQRAFFQTVKDGIAQTFDVNAEYLKRLIKIQQNDSTAARLGMEAYLNEFLNVYVQNTEYLQSTFDSVANSLLEASALLSFNARTGVEGSDNGTAASLEFEAAVQKWLGYLSGLGLSDSASQSIADALGKLGSGNVNVIEDKMGALMVMAASRAGQNIGEILTNGLDVTTTNNLLNSMVLYLQEIAINSDNNIIKNQLADLFGVSISDLVSIMNVSKGDLDTLNETAIKYSGMYEKLTEQFRQLPTREGIANILENLFDNYVTQTGMSIASNPISYATWKITDLIGSVTGGINIPTVGVLGNFLGMNTTLDNLIKLGIVGVSTLSNIGRIAGGLASVGDGAKLLESLNVNAQKSGLRVVTNKGSGIQPASSGKRVSGLTTSGLGYATAYTTDSAAYTESALNKAQDEAKEVAAAKTDESETTIKTIESALERYFKSIQLSDKLDTIIGNQSRYALVDRQSSIETSSQTVTNNLNNGSTTNITSTSSSIPSNPNIGNYLEDINFVSGFRSIVDNISNIKDKLDKLSFPTYPSGDIEPPLGFTSPEGNMSGVEL